MRKGLIVSFRVLLLGSFALRPGNSQMSAVRPRRPKFTADGKLLRPEGYRRWVYVSSGYGMSYSQKADDSMVMFTNVFVNPSSYDYYLAHGNWPDKTTFVLELYGSRSPGSINKNGSCQTHLLGPAAEIKSGKRLAANRGPFCFGNAQKAASAPRTRHDGG